MTPEPSAASKSPPRYLTGCVLAICAPLAVFLACGMVLGVLSQLVDPNPTVPHPVFLAVMSAVILGALSAFFVMVSKRLYASYRGHETAHLMPVWLSVALATVLGLGGLATLVASARSSSYAGAAASITFLGYAFTTTRNWIVERRKHS